MSKPDVVPIPGKQRLRNISTKSRILAAREMRAFMAGEIPSTGMWNAKEQAMIARELDRVYALGFAAGRTALNPPAGQGEPETPHLPARGREASDG